MEHLYTEEIVAIRHTLVADEASKVEATCSKVGKGADSVCSACGTRVAGAEIPAKAHSYGSFAYNNDATQAKDGTKSRTGLRSQTMSQFESLMREKRWTRMAGGENGRINWNGKLLVNFYYMKY